jgi:meso-butanediol dehydrogenase / (S,S)-butanediol dehydrogenase / diacetyl reductase
MGTLDGKVALVTGAGQGVGEGIALALATEGAQVMAAGRTLEKVAATADVIRERGGIAQALACDVKHEDEILASVAATVEAFGTVDILVNNAQEVSLGPLLDMTRDNFESTWLSGPVAAFSYMKACHEHLRDGGVVINLATSASLRLDPQGYGVYGAVKDAMRTLSRVAGCEWGPDGIRVICVVPLAKSPGYQMWEQMDADGAAEFAQSVPLGYVGDCEHDIGGAVAFLCGPGAKYITATTITVDGGQAYVR